MNTLRHGSAWFGMVRQELTNRELTNRELTNRACLYAGKVHLNGVFTGKNRLIDQRMKIYDF